MSRRSGGLFAGRGIALPGLRVTLGTIVACFAIGIGAGWVTAQVPDWYRAWSEPEPTVSASPSATPEPDVTLPEMAAITRPLDEDDAAAGIITTVVEERGEGTFSPATGSPATSSPSASAEASAEAAPTRYVRIDVEDGVAIDDDAFADYVMETLNDPRGWGSAGRLQFVLTDGAADVRVVLASPYTLALQCSDVHTAAETEGAAPSASAAPAEDAESSDPACASAGIVPVSTYDWTAGLERYGGKRVAARAYLLNHGVGHVFGSEDAECESGRADVMVDQAAMGKECKVNPWPFPDAATS
ncbi:DUF3152 domain-containing protein [Demequina mangrovi]|uniref:DUF3152 domain-containing protein n=1 Tax=Demequina mangrovi TaxID=1043493 RepID=A0A1H6WRC2_9MICO|nr:DUF3152 domain-containing protein [Demequina mangrovi]SEJ19531.1 Protein of unknown function [Demequina mangrovi]